MNAYPRLFTFKDCRYLFYNGDGLARPDSVLLLKSIVPTKSMSSLDQKLKPGITVYLCTLNDQNKIESCLGSLGKIIFSSL